MTEFPPSEKLLGDFLRLQPHTRDGQWAAAEKCVDLVDRFDLGKAQILEYPEWPDGSGEKFPLVKILTENGPGVPGRSRELMTWLGHLDVVEPDRLQLERDALILQELASGQTKGLGRGSVDMWAGNIAYLTALALLRERGNARYAIQTILSSLEEAGSQIIHQAVERKDVEAAKVGATTEILVADSGETAPLYHGRTGRIGIHAIFKGAAPHSGAVDRDTSVIGKLAHRFFGRAIDELLDENRGFYLPNEYPGDTEGLLPKISHAIPGGLLGKRKGLSPPGVILQELDVFHSDPNLAPERVRTSVETYLLEKARTPREALDVRLEDRGGVPFIEPWITPADHPLVVAASRYADEIEGKPVPTVAANGVAEEGILFHRLGTNFVGWAPLGKDAHESTEYVIIDSIRERAEWLTKLGQHDGDLA